MGCNCKDHAEDIERGMALLGDVRALFIQRMTVDSDHHDRRRRDYNQAIFGYIYPGRPETYPVWTYTDMEMVLKCFDDAVKDWRRSWCDVENCRRK